MDILKIIRRKASHLTNRLKLKPSEIQGLHLQLLKSNVLYLWKYSTKMSEIFVSRLP